MKELQQYQLAYISKRALGKKSKNECKQQPSNVSPKYEKLSVSKYSHLSPVSTLTFEYLREFRKNSKGLALDTQLPAGN
jgi:hypothetical protein